MSNQILSGKCCESLLVNLWWIMSCKVNTDFDWSFPRTVLLLSCFDRLSHTSICEIAWRYVVLFGVWTMGGLFLRFTHACLIWHWLVSHLAVFFIQMSDHGCTCLLSNNVCNSSRGKKYHMIFKYYLYMYNTIFSPRFSTFLTSQAYLQIFGNTLQLGTQNVS